MIKVEGCEFKNHALGDIAYASGQCSIGGVRLRNCTLSSATEVDNHIAATQEFANVFSEDHDGAVGDTRQLTWRSVAEGTPMLQSEDTIVRVGGSTYSIKVTPSTRIGTGSKYARILVLELPVYMAAASKTLTVYFRPGAIADWTADPLATELWAELEYWGHATNNFRTILKSTGVIDMNGDVSWQALTVTATPAQVGVAYLRVWYAKTKEAGDSNVFYCDPLIEIT